MSSPTPTRALACCWTAPSQVTRATSVFEKQGNLHGFEAFQTASLDLATKLGYAKQKMGLFPSGLNYKHEIRPVPHENQDRAGGTIPGGGGAGGDRDAHSGGELDDRTIVSFTINFKPNQTEFSAVQYVTEFTRVIETADKFGNAVVAIRGRGPTKTLIDLIKAGNPGHAAAHRHAGQLSLFTQRPAA